MKRRLFIAINLPETVKNTLVEYQNKWPDLAVKWTKIENLHITLVFIGDIERQNAPVVEMAIKEAISKQKPFSIRIDKISYSPYKKGKEAPRMIWASGELSKEFLALKKEVEKKLKEKIKFVPEKREAQPHITLARVNDWQWRRVEPDEQPEIEDYLDLKIMVDSVELMKGVLKRSGPEYTILESYELK